MAQTLSDEALDELLREAAEGHLHAGDYIDLEATDLNPLVGELVEVRWRVRGADGEVAIEVNGEAIARDAPLSGDIEIRAGTEATTVMVRWGLVSSVLRITPRFQIPVIRQFLVDRIDQTVLVGEARRIHWRIDNANSAQLRIVTPSGVRQRNLALPAGTMDMEFPEAGEYRFELVGHGLHAELIREGRCEETLTVGVIHPMPEIEITANPDTVPLGQAFDLNWSSQHADRLVLDDGETQWSVDLHGHLPREAVALGERNYRLIADGPGGHVERSVVVQCVAPPVEIELKLSRSRASVGDTVAVRWSASGAREVTLQCANGSVERVTGPKGTLQFAAMVDDLFVLEAVGQDGRRHRCQRRLAVRGLQIDGIERELTLIQPTTFPRKPSVVTRVWQHIRGAVA